MKFILHSCSCGLFIGCFGESVGNVSGSVPILGTLLLLITSYNAMGTNPAVAMIARYSAQSLAAHSPIPSTANRSVSRGTPPPGTYGASVYPDNITCIAGTSSNVGAP